MKILILSNFLRFSSIFPDPKKSEKIGEKENENFTSFLLYFYLEFDGDNLTAQAAVFFTAGFDTSSSLLSFTLYELALHPEIQTHVRNEIKDAFEKNNEQLTYDLLVIQF